ncbi:FxSxx-COOH cyclophane-containing RiPP peptide [Streptomyces sp. ML-6]|uniref:FxSxx-COOH cyclophane-containing RiPP peptide n=1 Tax=unclassified Streptomyces TaxID=2593676 RepID=UPI0024C0DBE3|nr:FxSxx-COOH cyclophane-containing RiPP peptide [Streptomyces sp. ML-6]MDK0518649.1 FxSxx-COOH protein [Streptomyces sp. ML-6]
MKTSESPRAFAVAKKSPVSLAEIDTRGAEATRKLGRVLSAPADRHTQASTFSSAL